MSAHDMTRLAGQNLTATHPAQAGADDRQTPTADRARLSHEALLALARLLGRQAAIEPMKATSSTATSLTQGTIP